MADENKFAVAAIDVFDYQSVCCVVKAAERERMPVILMFYPDMRSYIPFTTMAGIALDCAAKASVPVGVHLDHGKSYDVTISGLAAGFPSVMYDGSMEDFEINIDITRKVTDAAHIFGVDVEAEIVREINDTQVELQEILSYHIYYYNRISEETIIAV